MLQRIQTLYLLGAFISLIIMFFIPLGHLVTNNDIIIDMYFNGVPEGKFVESPYKALPLALLMILSVMLTFITIFLYKRRNLQIRLSGINIFLHIGIIGLILFYMFNAAKQLGAEKEFNISIILPVIAIIFIYLAIRNIAKDEARVKASERIR